MEVDVPDNLPRLRADAGLLERAVANVVQNAARHNPPGRPPIRVSASALGDTVELRVADHGPGVPDEHKDRIFEAFQRLGDAPQGTGIGLGLAVARGFTEAMDGTLTAEDTPGGGLTLVFMLHTTASDPALGGGAHPAADAAAEGAPAPGAPEASSPDGATPRTDPRTTEDD